jgi:hypothetical protein
MPHPESEHSLRARLACALKETEDANALRLKQDAELVALRAKDWRLREALAQMIELTDHADSKDPHSPWCNGVHSEQGQCEGEYIAAGIIGSARAALAAGGDR